MDKDIGLWLKLLLESDIPFQFVPILGLPIIKKLCKEFNLPTPKIIAGNIVIGDIRSCNILLTSHLDELSFGFKHHDSDGGLLAPYHQYTSTKTKPQLIIIGVRNKKTSVIGKGVLIDKNGEPFCQTDSHIEIGDRAVYHYEVSISDNLIRGKALDDRTGVLISLLSLKNLLEKGLSVALVLTDGEEHIPTGYFSRYFPHILAYLKKGCEKCFIDGIYKEGLAPAGIKELPNFALVIPHSGYGKGYVVQPLTWGWLRDEMVPLAQENGINVKVCPAYYSRGDDWGLVTNPTTLNNFEGFFISYGAWGDRGYEPPLTVHVDIHG